MKINPILIGALVAVVLYWVGYVGTGFVIFYGSVAFFLFRRKDIFAGTALVISVASILRTFYKISAEDNLGLAALAIGIFLGIVALILPPIAILYGAIFDYLSRILKKRFVSKADFINLLSWVLFIAIILVIFIFEYYDTFSLFSFGL